MKYFWPLADIHQRHNSYENSRLQRRNVKLGKLNWDPQSTESLVQLFLLEDEHLLGRRG